MEAQDKENKVKSFWGRVKSRWLRFNLGYFYIVLGLIIGLHIVFLLISRGELPVDKLDTNIPNLLMFALVMASFVPMLVYSYTSNLIKEIPVSRFYYVMDFIVNEATFLITLSILVGCFIFIEANVQHNNASHFFLRLYYLWYFVVAILHSITLFLWTDVGETRIQKMGKLAFWGYTGSIYSWIGGYIIFALILLEKYFDNYFCSNSVVWLKLLIIVTSLWLLSFSVMWLIPAYQYQPLRKLEQQKSGSYNRQEQ